MSKVNYQTVFRFFAENGYTLLVTEYINCTKKMECLCSNNHQCTISWSAFRRGQRCRKCAHKAHYENARLGYEYIQQQIESSGYSLLSCRYVSYDTSLQIMCDHGHQVKITWSNFKRGHRCNICGHKRSAARRRVSYEYVCNYFQQEGCSLLEDEYKNATTKMQYICTCGREATTTWSRFKNGSRCKRCWSERESKERMNPDRELVAFNKLVARRCNSMLRRVLRGFSRKKSATSEKIVGYSHRDLQNRLSTHPSFTALKDKKWVIDHVFPIKAFADHGIDDMKIINCLENLRPLSHSENAVKNDYYVECDFLYWVESKIAQT